VFWTELEKALFIEAVREHGKKVNKIEEAMEF
jgi:hypothetical protein